MHFKKKVHQCSLPDRAQAGHKGHRTLPSFYQISAQQHHCFYWNKKLKRLFIVFPHAIVQYYVTPYTHILLYKWIHNNTSLNNCLNDIKVKIDSVNLGSNLRIMWKTSGTMQHTYTPLSIAVLFPKFNAAIFMTF